MNHILIMPPADDYTYCGCAYRCPCRDLCKRSEAPKAFMTTYFNSTPRKFPCTNFDPKGFSENDQKRLGMIRKLYDAKSDLTTQECMAKTFLLLGKCDRDTIKSLYQTAIESGVRTKDGQDISKEVIEAGYKLCLSLLPKETIK